MTTPPNPPASSVQAEISHILHRYKYGNRKDGYTVSVRKDREAVTALTRLILEAQKNALQEVQVYTDPSHQKMSPFTRLKTADQYIRERIAQIEQQEREVGNAKL